MIINPYRFAAECNSRYYDGSSYVNFGSDASLDNLTTTTFAFWILADDTTPANKQWIMGPRDEISGIGNMFLDLEEGGAIRLAQSISGDDGIWTSNSSLNTTPTWQHVCVTYDNTSNANNPIMYIDGIDVGVTENNAPIGGTYDSSNSDFFVGKRALQDDRYYTGLLADMRVYNDILTSTEVSNLASGTDVTDHLVAKWVGGDLEDSVGVNNGTNFGTTCNADAGWKD